jgi:hypothetical protein
VGDFKDGQPNGQGIEFIYGGSISRQGLWANGNLVQSFLLDAQRFPFNGTIVASAPQTSTPDLGKADRDRLVAELEASRKKQQELEDRLAASQAQPNNPQLNHPKPASATIRSAHALVIGNAAYSGSNRLDNTINDANAISQKPSQPAFTLGHGVQILEPTTSCRPMWIRVM